MAYVQSPCSIRSEPGPWALTGRGQPTENGHVDTKVRSQTPKPVAMVRAYVDLDVPVDTVSGRLRDDGGWLVPLADRATNDGEAVVVRLHPASIRHLGVPVRVLVGEDRKTPVGQLTLVPLRWEARTFSGLFPVLDGNLELTAAGPERCRLGLVASYRPPLGAVGEWLDGTVLHPVAQSTVRSFLRQVADRLRG